MKTVRTTYWLVVWCAAVALGGCRSASTRIYSLDSTAPTRHIDTYHAPALRVDTLNVPASWDRIQLLEVTPGGTLQISDLDHWSAPLAQLARQTLSDDLDQRLPAGSVIYPRLPKPDGALGIRVDILQVNVAASRASMRVSWVIAPAGESQAAKRSSASLQCPMSSTQPTALVHAWGELMGQLADRIAADAASFTTVD
jgi:uncharacterized lipoprotein YmbA